MDKMTMEEQKSVIPADKYKILQVLDKGAFGQVFKCQKKDTQEVVAIKVPLVYQDTEKEENFLKLLMAKYGDQNNIIKFYDSFKTPYGRAMIFECLEINLEDYLFDNMTDLRDIWSIIQQLATALVCLKKEGIIHGDLKFNNVMLVNKNKPLQVKLIDFGLAMYKSNVWKGRKMGIVEYRSPEIILGLKLTEALDVWSLGVMTAAMAMKNPIFPSSTEFEILKVITKLIGPIPDHLLHRALWSSSFFETDGTSFRLKTDEEYLESHFKEFEVQTFYTESFTSLEELVETFVEVNNQQESEDLDAFIDLLICMLHVDGEKRITPAQILEQPFISGISIKKRSRSSPVASSSNQKAQQKEGFVILNPLTSDEIKDILPRKYSFIKLQATGQFGQVFKCESKHNQKVHSFKLPYSHHNMEKEAQLLRRMMCKGLEDQHIVQCMAFIKTRLGKAFIYENLDMNLTQFMATNCPLTLGDVRSIVQQTATALKSLKCMRVIHTEVTLDHVWLCAQTARLEVKLTDFQSSIHSKSAEPGMKLQNVNYRAPEIILGLAFSEAIDVWSLGTMMASMLLRFDLFPNQSEFETLKIMVKYFGKLPDEILSEGLKTDSFFKKHGQSWKLMTDQEFVKKFHLAPGDIQVYRSEMFSTFEELIRNNSQASCCQEMQKLQDCLALMYQMLQMKEAERITAAQIIDHPALSERMDSKQEESWTTPMLVKSDNSLLEKTEHKPDSSWTTPTTSPVDSIPTPSPVMVKSTPKGHTPPVEEPETPSASRNVERPLQSLERASNMSSGRASQKHLTGEDPRRIPKVSNSELVPSPKLKDCVDHTCRGSSRKRSKKEKTSLFHRFYCWLRK